MYNETYLRMQIVDAGRKLTQRFFVASNDGNISTRFGNDFVLITPTGINKGEVVPDQIVKLDLDGNLIEGHMKVTSEYKMHLAVYKARPDVKAIVHAHPPATTAFAVSGEKIDDPLILPEALFGLGQIGYCDYGTPSTDEVPNAVLKEIPYSDALLLANHGALTCGDDVMQAYYRMENLEMVARITLATKIIGKVRALDELSVQKLNKVKEQQGWGKTRKRPSEVSDSQGTYNLEVDKVTKLIMDIINKQK